MCKGRACYEAQQRFVAIQQMAKDYGGSLQNTVSTVGNGREGVSVNVCVNVNVWMPVH